MKNRILVLAPHTDDAELGCGGFISKCIDAENRVTIINFSNAWQSLPQGYARSTLVDESIAAAGKLGLRETDVKCLDFQVREFQKNRQEILDTLIELRSEVNPDIVLMPSSDDIHQDHGCVTMEAKRAFKHSTCLGYELPWNSFGFRNDYYCSLSQRNIERKICSLSEYKSQEARPYFGVNLVKSTAQLRGMQVGVNFAECFEIIRMIWK